MSIMFNKKVSSIAIHYQQLENGIKIIYPISDRYSKEPRSASNKRCVRLLEKIRKRQK